MTSQPQDDIQVMSVADAKARFSELADRVGRGERFVVTRRGRPTMALVAPDEVQTRRTPKLGLAAMAGALADWDDLDDVVDEILRARRVARDRDVPDLG